MVTGPLLAQPVVKPPNEITKAFHILKQVGSGDGPQINKTPYEGYFGNDYSMQKSYDIPMDKSWKHDMFTAVPQQQQNYYYDASVQVYPVDNENEIPTEHYVPQKYATNSPNLYDKTPFTFDSNLPSKLDFDLATLFALPIPKQEAASPEYIIPDHPLELSYGNVSSLEEGLIKDSTGIWAEALTKENPMDLLQNSEQQGVDPFVNEYQKEEPRLYPVPSTDSLLSEQSSPLSSATVSSPMNQDPAWNDESLQQLLETPFDFSDMDFFLPPPPKKIHDSPEPVVMSPQFPSSPEPIQETPSPLSVASEDYVKPKPRVSPLPSEKPKSKSTILFGKHEDEIIHKLLVPNLSTPSKPITRDKLVSMPVEEFNHLLEMAQLNDIEVAFMKEWRRRGKNKTAAQVARKRKREEVGDLESEVEAMRRQKAELEMRYDQLRSQIKSLKERSLAAESRVYKQYSRSSGRSVSRDTHLIHVSNGDKLLLVPRINSQIISVN